MARRPLTRRSKFGAVRTTVDGITFASKREARVYGELKLREKAGEIQDIRLQPRYPLVVNGVKIAEYVADFAFWERKVTSTETSGSLTVTRVVADAKGVVTPVYRMKRALMKALHGIDIREL